MLARLQPSSRGAAACVCHWQRETFAPSGPSLQLCSSVHLRSWQFRGDRSSFSSSMSGQHVTRVTSIEEPQRKVLPSRPSSSRSRCGLTVLCMDPRTFVMVGGKGLKRFLSPETLEVSSTFPIVLWPGSGAVGGLLPIDVGESEEICSEGGLWDAGSRRDKSLSRHKVA